MKKTNILITGCTGFIGKQLVNELSKPEYKRKYNITCFARKPFRYKYVIGSLEDKNSLDRAIRNMHIVIHLAGETRSSDRKLNYKINVIGTKNVIEMCRKNKIKKIIYSGTVNSIFKRRGVYGETKRLAESLVKNSGLNYVILKFNMVYGPGDSNLSKTINLVKKLPIIPIIGNGKATLQPVCVNDAANAIISSLENNNLKNRIYHIAGSEAFTFNEYIDIISSNLYIKRIKIHIPAFLARFFIMITGRMFESTLTTELINSITQDKSVDISPAKKDLGFNPRSFRSMINMLD